MAALWPAGPEPRTIMSKFCTNCQYNGTAPLGSVGRLKLKWWWLEANKKAGEYSEEDTHRPAHHYREVVVRRTLGGSTGQSANRSLRKRRVEPFGRFHNWTPLC